MHTLHPNTITATALAASLQQGDCYARWLTPPSTRNAWLLPVLRLLTGAAARIAERLERQALRG